MNIVIVGAGVVGSTLAMQLSGKNHVSVIERDPETAADIGGRFDVFMVTGNGSYPGMLREAGVASADMLIAVTPDDEANLLVCALAKQLGVPKRIARISSEEYMDQSSGTSIEELGVTCVIQPENEVVKYILQLIELPGVSQTANLQNDSIYMRGYVLAEGMPLTNVMLRDVDKLPDYSPMLVVVVIRDGKAIVPTGDLQLMAGDEIITVMPSSSFESFRKLVGVSSGKLGKMIVYGNSLTTLRLVGALRQAANRIILVDPDEAHGRQAAAECSDVEVLHGDCTSPDILNEIGVNTADFFVAAGNDGEDNIISALMAKAEGAKNVVAVRNDSRHAELFAGLGLNHVVVPRKITSEKILETIQMLPMGNIIKLKNIDMEFAHFEAGPRSAISGRPLKTLDKLFKKQIVIAGVVRDGKMLVPNGETVIAEGDKTLVLCARKKMGSVKKLF